MISRIKNSLWKMFVFVSFGHIVSAEHSEWINSPNKCTLSANEPIQHGLKWLSLIENFWTHTFIKKNLFNLYRIKAIIWLFRIFSCANRSMKYSYVINKIYLFCFDSIFLFIQTKKNEIFRDPRGNIHLKI